MTNRQKLTSIARNFWWSWNPEALDIFRRLAPEAFAASESNPWVTLRHIRDEQLDDPRVAADINEVYGALQSYLNAPPRMPDAPRTSYFCMEYGLHESLHSYSGGLGVLAGDHAKAASDLGLPFTAIGLLLRDGYFKQTFDEHGTQQAQYLQMNTDDHPLELVTEENGQPLLVPVRIGHDTLRLQAWRLDVGRTTMYFLDSDHDQNADHLRGLTRRLYQGGRPVRIRQEVILGIGGVRLLRALGIETDVYHMNEGHCAFLSLELIRELQLAGVSFEDAVDRVREQCVFTTHTPVMAGHDRFEPELFGEVMWPYRDKLSLTDQQLMGLGRVNPDDHGEWFTMTVLGLKTARVANGVSKLNGEVARGQWKDMYPDLPLDDVPIGSITNGIHLPTWTAPLSRAFFNERVGNWLENRFEPEFWKQVADLPAADLWALRQSLRGALVSYVNERLPKQTVAQEVQLDPDALTIGFARRFATYKRAPLIFRDVERVRKLFASEDKPVQIIFAGKAHPDDEGGKDFIRHILNLARSEGFRGKVVFLEDYNMEVGRMLVSGCDVWLNNPRRPMEASGTSGQKIAVHGGLNLSILDGWWPEGYNGTNGWAIDAGRTEFPSYEEQDAADSEALYRLLEEEVIADFYDRNADGVPEKWVKRMKAAFESLPYAFSAERMVADYVNEVYRTATIDA